MMRIYQLLFTTALSFSVIGCGFDGGPLITGDSDHQIRFGGPAQDSAPLSVKVKQALKKNPQTALSLIEVSTPSEDTVKLTGSVDNEAIRYEAEQVAGRVQGVRFVVNNLSLRN